jgi:large subunit ribosomal protein L25
MENEVSMQTETATLPAVRRTHLGTKYTRRLRAKGQIPAIVYGHGEDPVAVAMDAHEIDKALTHHCRVLALHLDGATSQCLIKSVQYDHLDTTPIHLDLVRVNLDERVQVTVPIELRGTPKGAAEGGVVTQLLNSIDVECVVTAIPEDFRPSIAHLGLDEFLLVKDLEFPAGMTPLANPDEKIATCRLPVETVEEAAGEEVEAAEGGAEPEVIGRAKEEESEEGA